MTHFNVPSKKKQDWTHSTRKPRTILEDMKAVVMKQPLTKRSRRAAKKLFKKTKHSPWGYTRFPHYQQPELPPEVLAHQARVNEHAMKMFKRPYFKLTSQQQTKVFEDFNGGEKPVKKETI